MTVEEILLRLLIMYGTVLLLFVEYCQAGIPEPHLSLLLNNAHRLLLRLLSLFFGCCCVVFVLFVCFVCFDVFCCCFFVVVLLLLLF